MSSFWIWHYFPLTPAPLFEPPLDLQKRIHMWIEVLFRAIARSGVQIRSAMGTQTFAVYRAKRLHRKSQQNLFAQNIGNGQLSSGKKRSPRIGFAQFDLFILFEHFFVALPEEEIERFADNNFCRLQTSGTRHPDRRFQESGNSNFIACPLGGSGPVQRPNLLNTFACKIDYTGLERGTKRDFLVA